MGKDIAIERGGGATLLRDEDVELGPSGIFLPRFLDFFFPGTLSAPVFDELTFGESSKFSEDELRSWVSIALSAGRLPECMLMLLEGMVNIDELTSLAVVRSTRLIPVPPF